MKYPKTRKSPTFGAMNCQTCGVEVRRRSALQKYCHECSVAADLKRKRVHQMTRGRERFSEEQERYRKNGAIISRDERKSLIGSLDFHPELIWYVRLAFPFSWSGSKNHLFTTTRTGHTFLRDESRYYRTMITDKVAQRVRDQRIAQNKLWLDIYVQKPNHRGDATNFVDMVCDAVKDATLLDDRWYSIRGVDWQIVKHEPVLYIGIGQDDTRDLQACSYCGRLLEFDQFQKNRAAKNGISRVCRECQSVHTAERRNRARAGRLVAQCSEKGIGVFG